MEMHHKLRRDPNWHPNGCNLCGVLGHQASVCPNGTVNWREKYGGAGGDEGGEEAWRERFTMDPAVYASEDPSCSFGNGWRRHEDDDGKDGGGGKRGKGGYRAPRAPARLAASDPKAVEEAARRWAGERRGSGRAELDPIPPARRGRQQQVPPQGLPPGTMMTMPPPMMGPPPPYYGGMPVPMPMPMPMPPPGYYGGGPPPAQMGMRPPPQQQWLQQQQQPPSTASAPAAAASAAAAGAPAAPSKRPAAPGSPPPAGWGKAVDAKGRTYYWNKKDKSKVSWKKPTADE